LKICMLIAYDINLMLHIPILGMSKKFMMAVFLL
jgi:hypothetical protein